MIERAVLQEVVSRDGTETVRECPRPEAVRENAKILMSWRDGARDACSNCGGLAVIVRNEGESRAALCAPCREQREARAIVPFKGTLRSRSETRADIDPDAKGIVGWPIVFDSRSVDLGGFVEVVKPSAITESMLSGAVHAFWGHNSEKILGFTGSGTLSLRKDTKGVHVVIAPPRGARDLVETIERGDLSRGSFGFVVTEDEWHMDGRTPLRELRGIELREISPVAFPAYPATRMRVEKLSSRSLLADEEREYRLRTARA